MRPTRIAVFDSEHRIISTYDPGPGGLTRTVHTQDRPLFLHRLRRHDSADPYPIVVEVPKVRSWEALQAKSDRDVGERLIINAMTPALIGLTKDEALELAAILTRYAEDSPSAG